MKRLMMLTALLLFTPIAAFAETVIEEAWVRLPPPVADTAAAYMTIRNHGDKDIEITGIKTAAAKSPEFHSMEMHDGMMHMMKMEKVIVPAHGGISFNPGGNHLMLIGLTDKLKTGEHIMMTLETSEGESIMVHAEVRDMRGNTKKDEHKMDGDMQGHDMHGMHH
jgi:copper(I)-binding protein